MGGYIIYNGFWNPKQPPEPVRALEAAGRKVGLPLLPLPNTMLLADIAQDVQVAGFSAADFVLFWDKDVRLAQAIERCGARVYNPAEGVRLCDDKAATHLALTGHRIPMPRTLVAPMTYLQMELAESRWFLRRAVDILGFPMVVKECYGSLGGQVYLAKDLPALEELVVNMGPRPFILQEFIEPAGRDVRLYVVGDKVVAAMQRRSDGDFRANVALGGETVPYTPAEEEIWMARRSCQLLGLDFGGVDLLHDKNGAPLLCEVNSNAHMAGISACTGVDVALCIMQYVREQEQKRKKA